MTIKFILLWQKRIIFKLRIHIHNVSHLFFNRTLANCYVTLSRALFPKCMSTFNSLLSTRHPHTLAHTFLHQEDNRILYTLFISHHSPFFIIHSDFGATTARHSNVKNVRTCFKCFTAAQQRLPAVHSLEKGSTRARALPFKSHVRNKMCHPNRRRRTFRRSYMYRKNLINIWYAM